MKIALLPSIGFPLPPQAYAPWEKVVHLLATGLVRMGEDVTVFAAQDSVETDYKIVHTVDKSLTNLTDNKFMQESLHIAKAAKMIGNMGFDVVNNHINWNGMMALDLVGANVVTTIHGFEEPSKYFFRHFPNNKYISLSYAERKKVPELNYIANIPNPIDFDFFELVEQKEDYLFTAARICREKGIHHAVKLAQLTNTRLIIAGRMQDKDYFEKEVLPHVDGKKIEFIGEVPQTKMRELSGKAKAYLSILDWHEPFGLSVAEAIACGTPVIANKMGSMPELVEDMKTGLLVEDVEDAAARFVDLDKISAVNCRETGKSIFSMDKVAALYLDAYKSTLK